MIDKIIKNNTLLDELRLNSLITLMDSVNHINGNVAEVGTYKGGSSRLLCNNKNKDHVYIFDTFEGLPMEGGFDNFHKKGDFSDTNLEYVESVLKPFTNYTIFPMKWPSNSQQEFFKNLEFKFVHLDVDLYNSYKDNLEYFYTKLVTGGIIVCDDYGHNNCKGAKKAIDEFVEKYNIILYTGPTTQCHFMKRNL